jgi:hypothetical protein
LILGLGNLALSQLEAFLASLQKIGFCGEVGLLIYNMSAADMKAVGAYGVTFIDMNRSLRPTQNAMNSRFLASLEFLSSHHDTYQRVLLTDTRDVVFQSDPFALIGEADVVFASEHAPIRECPVNRAWINHAYGPGVLENIQANDISCAGTTIGTTAGILRYLAAMVCEMTNSTMLDFNVDQAIHNYIVHMRPFKGASLDRKGRIFATIDKIETDSITFDGPSILIDGYKPPVVHQWDRRAKLAEHVRTHFRLPIDAPTGEDRFKIGASHSQTTGQMFSVVSRLAEPPAAAATREAGAGGDTMLLYVGASDRHRLQACIDSLRSACFAGRLVLCARAETALTFEDPVGQTSVERYELPPELGEANAAHVCFSRLIPLLRPARLIALANARCLFQGNPFEYLPPGLSLFAEGSRTIGQCACNKGWLSHFGAAEGAILDYPIVSSDLVGGTLPEVIRFYERLTSDFTNRHSLFTQDKVIQGLFQVAAYGGTDRPRVHANGSFAFSQFWPTRMAVNQKSRVAFGGKVVVAPKVTAGGSVPAILLETKAPPAEQAEHVERLVA